MLAPEPDNALFELLSRLTYLTLAYIYATTPTTDTINRLTSELFDAFVIWRTGDKYEARAAFVLALVHATRDLG